MISAKPPDRPGLRPKAAAIDAKAFDQPSLRSTSTPMNAIRSIRGGLAAVSLLAALLATACRSPPSQFYTLVRLPVEPAAPPLATFQIDVLPVDVPAQVDVPQMVVREGAGQVVPVETRRWIAPLHAELRTALSNELTLLLGARDIHGLTPSPDMPTYRVKMKVQRFDSVLGDLVQIDAIWRVRETGADKPGLLCGSRVIERADGDYAGLAVAHQRAIATIAQQIGGAIRALRASRRQCPEAAPTRTAHSR